MLSYVLIDGVNDSDADAERLVGFARRFPSSVNLIPLNEHEQSPDMAEPKESRLQAFRTILLDQGVYTTVRRSRGRDVTGACGQLVTEARRKKSQRVVVSSSSS